MKKYLLSLLICCITLLSYSQKDNPDCLEKTFKFFTTFDSFYLTDYCKYSEFGSADFMVDNGAQSVRKERVYREVWFHKKEDNNRVVSGLQILQNHFNAIKAVGGEVELSTANLRSPNRNFVFYARQSPGKPLGIGPDLSGEPGEVNALEGIQLFSNSIIIKS